MKIEKYTPLAKKLHCRRQWRQWQISPLIIKELAIEMKCDHPQLLKLIITSIMIIIPLAYNWFSGTQFKDLCRVDPFMSPVFICDLLRFFSWKWDINLIFIACREEAWFPDFVSYIIKPRVRFWNSSAAYEMYTLCRMENVKSNRAHNKFWCQWSSLRGLNDGYRTWWKASQLLLPSQQYNWTITHQQLGLSHNDIYKTKDWKERDRWHLIIEMTTQC